MKRKINYVLFDLDETLLEMDLNYFFKRYFEKLTMEFEDLIKPEKMYEKVWSATEVMIKNTDHKLTNSQVFWKHFISDIEDKKDEFYTRFEHFYNHKFAQLRKYTNGPTSGTKKLLGLLSEKGYGLVIATNPVFPKSAILERMRWAEIDKFNYLLITDYETMHFCKPHTDYYMEIADMLCFKPEKALMIGNSIEEDMIAKKTGMTTFHFTNNPDQELTPAQSSLIDYKGNLVHALDLLF